MPLCPRQVPQQTHSKLARAKQYVSINTPNEPNLHMPYPEVRVPQQIKENLQEQDRMSPPTRLMMNRTFQMPHSRVPFQVLLFRSRTLEPLL